MVANQLSTHHKKTKSALEVNDDTEYSSTKSNESKEVTASVHPVKDSNSKNLSKAAMLRQLFFSQINQNNNATADSQNIELTSAANSDGVSTIKK